MKSVASATIFPMDSTFSANFIKLLQGQISKAVFFPISKIQLVHTHSVNACIVGNMEMI